MARRNAAGAALCACLAATVSAGAGEERRASVALRGCEISLDAPGSEPVLMLRAACAPTLEETRDALHALLARLHPGRRLGDVTGLCLGRAEALPWLSERLTAAALRSPEWDARRGRPRSGSPERFVAELLRTEALAAELVEVVEGFGAEAEIGSVEKVLVRAQGDAQLPYDAIVWLRLRAVPLTGR
jgi:hypothetical protein